MDEFRPSARFNSPDPSDDVSDAVSTSSHTHTWYKGSVAEMSTLVPDQFRRQPFIVEGKENPRYDVILMNDGTPVGVVSKRYSLIDHRFLVDSTLRSLEAAHIDLDTCECEVYLGDGGAKFGFRIFLKQKSWNPGDETPIIARVAGFNSVDGSLPFRLIVGFYRRICSNGLSWGVGRVNLERVHLETHITNADVVQLLNNGINSLDSIATDFVKMHRTKVTQGFKDAVFWEASRRWGKQKSEILKEVWESGRYGRLRVPGISPPCRSVWDVLNSLTWIASGQQALARQEKMLAECNEIVSVSLRESRIILN